MKKRGKVKELGTVLHMVDNKLIVKSGGLKVEKAINSVVMTEDKRKIGRVYDIFGSVNRPYVSIKAFGSIKKEELQKLLNKRMFLL
ncbi:MAG TPA: RNA-binding protein [Methanophagales archaeon]|nr:RNA-binding protein [Methanophagales archaeon]